MFNKLTEVGRKVAGEEEEVALKSPFKAFENLPENQESVPHHMETVA